MPKFCRDTIRSIHKILQFLWSMLIFGKKILLFRTPQSRNSTTLPTLLGTLSKMQAKKEAVVLAYFVRHWLLFFWQKVFIADGTISKQVGTGIKVRKSQDKFSKLQIYAYYNALY